MRARWLIVLALGSSGCERRASAPPPGAEATPAGRAIEEARTLIDQGQPDAALAKLEGAPADAEALYLQGRAWAKKAESAPLPTPPPLAAPLPAGAAPPAAPDFKPEELRALELYEKSTAARPTYAPAQIALAELLAPHAIERLERERQVAAALAARKRSRRRGSAPAPPPPPPPEGPDASVDRVVQAYRQAIQADAGSRVAVEGLIAFAVRAGRLEEADSAYQELVRRDKENPEPLIRYGDFLVGTRKNPQGAIALYSQALIWQPDDDGTKGKIADIYLEMAREHLAQDEWASAEARLREAQRYVSDKSSPQGLKMQDLRAELAQIRRPVGK